MQGVARSRARRRADWGRRGDRILKRRVDGTRLLGGVVGQDAWTGRESYAIDPLHGGLRLIAHSVMPSALSRDGRYAIGQTGDPECCGFAHSNIVRVPWAGGTKHVLLPHAMVASFNG